MTIKGNATVSERRRGGWLCVLVLLALCLASPAGAMFSTYTQMPSEEDSDTSLKDVFYDRDTEADKERPRGFFADELRDTLREAVEKPNDLDLLDRLAYVQFRSGQTNDALATWRIILGRDPKRFVTLYNYALGSERLGKYDDATTAMAAAASVGAKYNHGVAPLQVKRMEFMNRHRATGNFAHSNLFIPEFTAVWQKRKNPPDAFKGVEIPKTVTPLGVAEVLRHMPQFGDGWLVLGIILEADDELRDARVAYQRAMKFGNGQGTTLRGHLKQLDQITSHANPIQSIGWKLLYAFGGIIILVLVIRFRGIITDVKEDLSTAKSNERARRAREATKRKDVGPL